MGRRGPQPKPAKLRLVEGARPVDDLLAYDAPMVKMRQGFVSISPPTKELPRIFAPR